MLDPLYFSVYSRQQLCVAFLVCLHFQYGLAILNYSNNNNGSSTSSTRIRQKTFIEVMDASPSAITSETVTAQAPATASKTTTSTSLKSSITTAPTPLISTLESIKLKCTLSSSISNENCTSICDGVRYFNGSRSNTTTANNVIVLDTTVTNELFTMCPNIESLSLNNSNIFGIGNSVFEQASALKQLNLSSNHIKEVTGDAFKGAYLLSVIDLSKNAIQTIASDAFKKLNKLMVLDLSANRLKTINMKLVQDCTSLTQLSLRQNTLHAHLELHFTSRVLQLIDLSANNLIGITFKTPTPKKQQNAYPRNFSNVTLLLDDNCLVNLTISPAIQIFELSLAHNRLESINELIKIRPFLARILNLEGNRLTYLDPKLLPVSSKLEVLKLRDNRLSDLDVLELKTHFTNLNQITVTQNDWNCKDLKRIVTQLDVRDIRITDINTTAIYDLTTPNVHGVPCFDSKHELFLLRLDYTTKLNKITLISVCTAGFLIILMCLITFSSCRTLQRLRSDSLSKSFEIKMMPTENIYEEHVYNNVYSNPTTPTTTL